MILVAWEKRGDLSNVMPDKEAIHIATLSLDGSKIQAARFFESISASEMEF